MWKVTNPKLNIIWNILTPFLARKLSTIRPLLINSKCENLSILKVDIIYNILMTILAHKLSTLYPLFIIRKCKKYRPQKLISPAVISSYKWL
jgi:hypothetical protein